MMKTPYPIPTQKANMNTAHLLLSPAQAQSLHTALKSTRKGPLGLTERNTVDLVISALHEHRYQPPVRVRETTTTTVVTTTRII